jgi:hypothetical protein
LFFLGHRNTNQFSQSPYAWQQTSRDPYHRKITVVSDGESLFSTTFTVHVDLVTGIETEITGKVLIYPNPVTNDQVVIFGRDNAPQMVSYRIIDARGMLVKEENINLSYECAIPLPGISPGIYTILFTLDGQRIQSIKFIKQ